MYKPEGAKPIVVRKDQEGTDASQRKEERKAIKFTKGSTINVSLCAPLNR